MEVLNKILPLILTAIMSVNLSGCRSFVTVQENNTIAEITVQSSNNEKSKQKIKIEREIDDWSLEELANNITFEDFRISIPCEINDLEKHFEVIDVDNRTEARYLLKYKGENIAYLNDVIDDKVNYISFFDIATRDHNISLGKVKHDTKFDDIIRQYGESNILSKDKVYDLGYIEYDFPYGKILFEPYDKNNNAVGTSFTISFNV